MLSAAAYYAQYRTIVDESILLNSEYETHILKESEFRNEQQKIDRTRELLKLYSSAQLVLTSRIHCALPCLAMETPVIYIENVNKKISDACRLDGIIELLSVVKYNSGKLVLGHDMGKRITAKTVIINKIKHKSISEILVQQCKRLIYQEL